MFPNISRVWGKTLDYNDMVIEMLPNIMSHSISHSILQIDVMCEALFTSAKLMKRNVVNPVIIYSNFHSYP